MADKPNLLVPAAVPARSPLRHIAPPPLSMVLTQDSVLHIVNDHMKSPSRLLKALMSTMPYLPFPKISWRGRSRSHASKHKDYLQVLHSLTCLEKLLAPRFPQASPTPTTSARGTESMSRFNLRSEREEDQPKLKRRQRRLKKRPQDWRKL